MTNTQMPHQVLSGPKDASILVLADVEPSPFPRPSLLMLLSVLLVLEETPLSRVRISRSASDKTRNMANKQSKAGRFRFR